MEETKKGFRVVTNPELAVRDIKVFPEGTGNPDVERLVEAETSRPGALLYSVKDYDALTLLLNNTEGLRDVKEVRLCAAGRGYVKYDRRDDGAFPPEDAVRRVLASAPALPRPGASFTVRQDAEHPEGVVVKPGADQDVDGQERWARAVETEIGIDTVDRFVSCYMALGGTFGRLTDHLEGVLKRTAARIRAKGA